MSDFFEDYGQWPVNPTQAREKGDLVKITPQQWKHLVHGQNKHVHMSVISSTNYAQVGHVNLTPGSHSELENHDGDVVIFMIRGKMAVRIVETADLQADAENANRRHYELCQGEAFLIPEGYVHQYINLTDAQAVFFFGIGADF